LVWWSKRSSQIDISDYKLFYLSLPSKAEIMKRMNLLFASGAIMMLAVACTTTLPCSEADRQDTDKALCASGQGSSIREEIAREMAIVDGKQKLSEKIISYSEEKFKNNTTLSDEEYNQKLRIAQKTVLQRVAVSCTVVKKKQGRYYAYIGLEADISDMESIIRKSTINPKE